MYDVVGHRRTSLGSDTTWEETDDLADKVITGCSVVIGDTPAGDTTSDSLVVAEDEAEDTGWMASV